MMLNRYRAFAAYLLAIPLALFLGILAASPNELTLTLIGMLLFFLALPFFIGWHHTLLIVFWNSAFTAVFLPGQPAFWLLFAVLSFGLAVLNHIVGRRPFLSVPDMTRPLLFMLVVIVGTAWYHGGIGVRALGGAANGGKYYILVLGGIVGYFALTAGQISNSKRQRMAGLFFLSGTSYLLSNIVFALGPAFYILYYLILSVYAGDQAAGEAGLATLGRLQGLAPACLATFCFLLMKYGIRGLFDWTKPWKPAFLLIIFGVTFFCGFRSMLATIFLVFAFQFCFEGLVRTRLFPVTIGLAICGFIPILLFANKMPPLVQRTISFLPVNVDSSIQADAMGTSEWRFQMWAVLWKEVPKYLVIGKGYGIDPTELDSVFTAQRMGILPNTFEGSMLAGDYHSGPLSVIIPFGIMGAVAFLWVLFAGFRVLYLNYRHGDEQLRRINSVLLSYYLAYAVSFFFIFGAFNSELYVFLGVVGFSVCLNRGVMRKAAVEGVRSPEQPAYAIELR